MFTVRRWWDRFGSRIFVVGLVLGSAWFVRQTQGAIISELYRWAARPFEVSSNLEEKLTDARVLELEQKLAEVESQNQKLQALLGYVDSQKQEAIVAPVVGRSAAHWWGQITLGRGSNDGIKPGDIVMGTGGLIGRVQSTTPSSSRVLLVSDPTSKVGVAISRSREMGFMQGESAEKSTVQFFEKIPDVREGDAVVTSPVSQLFPSGLPVGTVEAIDLDKSPAPEATIQLNAPVAGLEWVAVHPFQAKE